MNKVNNMTSSRLVFYVAFCLLLFSQLRSCASSAAAKKSYIIYLGSHPHGRDATIEAQLIAENSHYEFLGSFVGGSEKAKEAIIYSYKRYINGFAAFLSDDEAAKIAEHPDVISVFLNQKKTLQTTHSWEFMGLDHKSGVVPSNSLWKKANFGEDIIIGHLDTGVWPESKSFGDEGYGPVPSRWRGGCQNNTAVGVPCNRKIIGAKFFVKGFEAFFNIPTDPSMKTPRDYHGHGSHTLSTSGGNLVPGVDVFGLGGGTAKGGSPRARLAAYKVCWSIDYLDTCSDADILEAIDMAIHDGVDVLSLSIASAAEDYFEDSIAIGAFHAVKHGIVVVCGAGNSGPGSESVSNVAPWILTVGATTQDREIQNFVKVHAKDGNMWFKGKSFSDSRAYPFPENKLYPMITGEQSRISNATKDEANLCSDGALDPEKVKGKILVCQIGEEMCGYATKIGAVGVVIYNDDRYGKDISAQPYKCPAIHIDYNDGTSLVAYINSTKHPLGLITAPTTKFNVKPAPYVVPFSARGPNSITYEILKPDITAPGVDIVGAYTESPSDSVGSPKVPYYLLSGTSMATPHVSGVVGLLKSLHPTWSPAAIKSAIMTTAWTIDNTNKLMIDYDNITATPFDYRSGHIRPNKAADPGLVYDMATKDYLNFLCSIGYNQAVLQSFLEDSDKFSCPTSISLMAVNYPAIMVQSLNKPVIVTRRLKNVGSSVATYKAFIHMPEGVKVTVEPSILTFGGRGEEKEFKVSLEGIERRPIPSPSPSPRSPKQQFCFGSLMWSDGKHFVRSPIGVGFIMHD